MTLNNRSSLVSSLKLIALFISFAGVIGAWTILPYRVEQTEKAIRLNNDAAWGAIKEIREKRDIDHEILVRIDERLKRLEVLLQK